MVEGTKVLEVALGASAEVEAMFVAPHGRTNPAVAALQERVEARGARVFALAEGVIERVADAVTPQPVVAIVRAPLVSLDDVLSGSLVVVCVDVRDPGNVGTIIRTAASAGAGGVVCCDGTADPTAPKCVRASAGALFQVPVVAGGAAQDVLTRLGAAGLRLWGTRAHDGQPLWDADLRDRCAFVLGNESTGLPEPLSGSLDGMVTIPMPGATESLNVSVATGIVCFEAARQRRRKTAVPHADGGAP